jgi:hypothetical protein
MSSREIPEEIYSTLKYAENNGQLTLTSLRNVSSKMN